jgi:hypothetical protein
MKTLRDHAWLWQYVLPAAILVLSSFLTVVIGTQVFGAEEPDFFWILAIMPLASFLIGVYFLPERASIIPLAYVAFALLVASFTRGIGDAVGMVPAMLLVFAAPIWLLILLGKKLRPWLEETFASRHDKPGMPAG